MSSNGEDLSDGDDFGDGFMVSGDVEDDEEDTEVEDTRVVRALMAGANREMVC